MCFHQSSKDRDLHLCVISLLKDRDLHFVIQTSDSDIHAINSSHLSACFTLMTKNHGGIVYHPSRSRSSDRLINSSHLSACFTLMTKNHGGIVYHPSRSRSSDRLKRLNSTPVNSHRCQLRLYKLAPSIQQVNGRKLTEVG